MRYGREDSYGDEGNYLDDFAVYNPANNLAVTPAAVEPTYYSPDVSYNDGGGLSYLPQYAAPSYTAPLYFAPEPFVPQYREPEPQYAAPFVPQYQEPTYTPPAPPAPQPMAQPGVPEMTPEFIQQLQQGAAAVGNAAQSGGLSSLFAPGTLSQLDPLYNYAKTAPIYDLAGNASTEQYKFQPLPDTKYRLVVNKDVIGEASTPAEAARLAELYNQYSSSGGNNIYVAFQKETPTADAQGNPTTTYIPFFENQNEKNRDALFQSMMMAAGAIMGGAALGPVLGGTAATATAPATAGVLGSGTLAGIAGTGLGTAAGTFAGGIGSGVPLDEALKRAAISGVTAGVLKGVMPGGVGDAAAGKTAAASKLGGFTPVPGAGGMTPIPVNAFSGLAQTPLPVNAFSGLAQSATAPIIVTAAKNAATSGLSNLASNAISAGIGAGTGALSTAAAPQANQPQSIDEPEIVVTNRLPPKVDLTGGLSTIPASTLLNLSAPPPSAPPPSAPPQTETQIDETPADDEIVVTKRLPPKVDLTGGLSALVPSVLPPVTPPPPPPPPPSPPKPTETPAEDEIVVTNRPPPKVDLTGGLSALVPSVLPPVTPPPPPPPPKPTETPAEDEIVVTNRPPPKVDLTGGLSTIPASTLLNLNTPTDMSLPGEDILVEASRTRPGRISDALPAATGALVPSQPAPVVDPGEIVVTGQKNKPAEIKSNLPVDLLAPVAGQFVVSDIVGGGKSLEQEQADKGEKKTDLSKKIGAGVGVLTLLDQLLGGGGGGGGGGINSAAGTRASLSPIFSAKLPEARGIFAPASFAPRDMSGTDFARYGYGPAKSFFENVPRNVEEYKAALAANSAPRPAPTGTAQPGLTISSTGQPTPGVANPQFAGATTVAAAIRRLAPDATDEQIDAYLSGPEGARFLEIMNESGITQRRARGGMMAAKGGASRGRDAYAVRGPGTGRSDEIPALLSDGEYVIDAETVAMLGDGSGEAGAKRLDEFRIKIRKHKGRNLARGKFSANAKRPDKYLSGGRV